MSILFCHKSCLVILELHKYSNNLSITVSAAPTEVQGILQEEFLFMDSPRATIPIAKNRRIKVNKPFQIGVLLCLFRSDFVTDCFQVTYRPLLFGSSSWKKVLIKMTHTFPRVLAFPVSREIAVLNCQHLLQLYFSLFQFWFQVWKNMVQTTCHFKPHYCLQWLVSQHGSHTS